MYKITLADGSFIDNLGLNGENFFSETPVDEAFFDPEKMNVVTITCDDPEAEFGTLTIEDAVLAKFEKIGTETFIVLREKTEAEKKQEALEEVLTRDYDNIVDLQLAIVELYEMIINA